MTVCRQKFVVSVHLRMDLASTSFDRGKSCRFSGWTICFVRLVDAVVVPVTPPRPTDAPAVAHALELVLQTRVTLAVPLV